MQKKSPLLLRLLSLVTMLTLVMALGNSLQISLDDLASSAPVEDSSQDETETTVVTSDFSEEDLHLVRQVPFLEVVAQKLSIVFPLHLNLIPQNFFKVFLRPPSLI
jgi:hypothetical protein